MSPMLLHVVFFYVRLHSPSRRKCGVVLWLVHRFPSRMVSGNVTRVPNAVSSAPRREDGRETGTKLKPTPRDFIRFSRRRLCQECRLTAGCAFYPCRCIAIVFALICFFVKQPPCSPHRVEESTLLSRRTRCQ